MAGGRPRKEINTDLAMELAGILCTVDEIAAILKVSPSLLYHNAEFMQDYKNAQENAKSSLRRAQYQAALKGNTAMLIWLGKQFLGQKDATKQEIAGEDGGKIEIRVIRDE